MKLASFKDGRDGRLVVVSKDLSRCIVAAEATATLQAALDDWATVKPQLEALAAICGLRRPCICPARLCIAAAARLSVGGRLCIR